MKPIRSEQEVMMLILCVLQGPRERRATEGSLESDRKDRGAPPVRHTTRVRVGKSERLVSGVRMNPLTADRWNQSRSRVITVGSHHHHRREKDQLRANLT